MLRSGPSRAIARALPLMKTTVLVLDDELKLRRLLSRIISLEGYEVHEAGSLSAARALLSRGGIDILLCDVRLPDGNGVDFTREMKAQHPQLQIILLTAFGNIPDGVRATKNGAFDYLVKGDDNDKIVPLLSQAADLVRQSRPTATGIGSSAPAGFEKVIGESKAIRDAVALARKVAPSDATVLLTGETGTGKEVFAQAIHSASTRRSGPFVALNCASLSRELLESTLFGYKAGAYTGATKDQPGLIDEAAGGTLFLDEIGELPADLQPKLLRFLEDGTYYRVGDPRQRSADVRLLSATNRTLQEQIAGNRFRGDLYYRIATFAIQLPALRDRDGDILLLANHFLAAIGKKYGRQIGAVSEPAQALLLRHRWDGNIRELKHVLERAVILEEGNELRVESLPPEIQEQHAGLDGVALAAVERRHICKVLDSTKGNKAEAARLLGIGIATLYRKLAEYNL